MLVRALVAALEEVGVDRLRLLKISGLDQTKLDDVVARVPFEQFHQLVTVAYELSADPALGLHLGERLTFAAFDVLGHLTEHSASLREALQMTLRFAAIVGSQPRLELEEHNGSATLKFVLPEHESLAALMAAEFATVMMLRLFRSFVGGDALPTYVFFVHDKPAHAKVYARYFVGRERFAQRYNGVEFPCAWLDRTRVAREHELQDFLLRRAELLLSKSERSLSTVERVKRWLAAQTDLSRPSLDAASRELGVSTRSLRRHLQGEQTLFSALVEDARAIHAKRTLSDSDRSIQETAYALGYRTPSAFARAFKRWTGMTPRAYRGDR
jgi:AraC-like DNA-binding protein